MKRASVLATRAVMLALCTAALAAVPASAASNAMVVKPDTLLHLAGTDMYCTVLKQATTLGVACFHDPGGPSSNVRKGYAVVGTEEGVAIEPPGTNTPSKGYRLPSLAKFGKFAGGAAHSAPVDMGVNQVAAVSGSHMAVVTAAAKGGGNAIGVTYLDPKYRTIVGTFTSRVVYRHNVYT
jgi:hypothetical protein